MFKEEHRKLKSKSQSQSPIIAFRPNQKLDSRLRRLAIKHNIPLSQIVRHCLVAHLPKLEKQFDD